MQRSESGVPHTLLRAEAVSDQVVQQWGTDVLDSLFKEMPQAGICLQGVLELTADRSSRRLRSTRQRARDVMHLLSEIDQ